MRHLRLFRNFLQLFFLKHNHFLTSWLYNVMCLDH
nr:MAG TPA: hypothetical protein [Caudoviricetes sp.]